MIKQEKLQNMVKGAESSTFSEPRPLAHTHFEPKKTSKFG